MEGHLRPCLTAPATLQWKGEAKICNYDQKGRATALTKFSSATWIFSGEALKGPGLQDASAWLDCIHSKK